MYKLINNLKFKSMNTHNILAVTKQGVDYSWFKVITTNNKELTVYNVSWTIDETIKEAEIDVLETDTYGQVERCIIRGKKKEIKNFMYSVGYGVSDKKSDSVYQHTVLELQSKVQSMMYEIEELKQQLEEKLCLSE